MLFIGLKHSIIPKASFINQAELEEFRAFLAT
ncbi:hypothetical protein [Pedobacter agri]